jgi:hypothetical protein
MTHAEGFFGNSRRVAEMFSPERMVRNALAASVNPAQGPRRQRRFTATRYCRVRAHNARTGRGPGE